MHEINERTILLRDRIELPDGLPFPTKAVCEGWLMAWTMNALQMEELIVSRGWTFARIGARTLRVGVGDSVKDAVANALRLGLRRVADYFNAAEVEHIELTQYPWFHLARVSVWPYRIQQSADLPCLEQFTNVAATPRKRRLPPDSSVLFPHFASAMPQLKQLLISSRTAQIGPQ